MKFSCFTPMGLYRLKAGPSEAKRIYDSLIANLGGQYSTDIGSRQEATCFATALAIARANARLKAAADQRLPTKVNELLPQREAAYGLVPGANDSMADRHAALAVRKKLPLMWTATNIRAALSQLLGSDFVAYKPTPQANAVMYPASCGAWPMHLARPEAPRKIIALSSVVATIGTSITVSVTIVSQPSSGVVPQTLAPVAGDVFVFEPGRHGQADAVTLTAVSPAVTSGGVLIPGTYSITGTFTRPHDAGVQGVTQPYPYWVSTQRHSLVVVSAAAAADPERRRKVDEAMRRMTTVASSWDIVAGTATTTTAFQLGSPGLGMNTLAAVSLP